MRMNDEDKSKVANRLYLKACKALYDIDCGQKRTIINIDFDDTVILAMALTEYLHNHNYVRLLK